eukprot:2529077-Alexandrium_andersonii.AAC.1
MAKSKLSADLSPICRYCNRGEETAYHIFWECECWQGLRGAEPAWAFGPGHAWPPCTYTCGIMVEDSE